MDIHDSVKALFDAELRRKDILSGREEAFKKFWKIVSPKKRQKSGHT